MLNNNFQIILDKYYKEEIIKSLVRIDKDALKFVIKKFELFENMGFINCCLKKDIKDFRNGLFEIRIKYKGLALRFLGSYSNNNLIIVLLLNKKSQKTPISEINKALNRIK